MKNAIEKVDATPSKRLFLSIIADYDINRSICELIDNALDLWVTNKKSQTICIKVELNKEQQNITVIDNVGGVKKENLKFIVGPGHTGNLPEEETIGIFGVGTKRAVVALAQDITITTRFKNEKTYQVEFDDNWLKDDDWSLPVYEVDDIPPSTTIIALQKLRLQINEDIEARLRDHLGAIYAKFLVDQKVKILLNSTPVEPLTFENWSYPPGYEPRRYTGKLESEDGGTIKVSILAGLSNESTPSAGEYGVYLYCNDRLICRGLKTHEIGFIKGLAGPPHPSVSLTRVIISLEGPAGLMPWNSSKSGINAHNKIFLALQNFIITVVKDYSSLSRRFEGDWPEKVFQYKKGDVVSVENVDFPQAKKSYLPQLPKSKVRYSDLCQSLNKKVSTNKPWTIGLYESVIATDLIFNSDLSQKNRISLILLDSTLEIAFKDYLVNESGHFFTDGELVNLFKSRKNVVDAVEKYKTLAKWRKKIDFYYGLRCKLVHERSSAGISDHQINDYREVVEQLLKRLFGLKFSDHK